MRRRLDEWPPLLGWLFAFFAFAWITFLARAIWLALKLGWRAPDSLLAAWAAREAESLEPDEEGDDATS